MLSRKMEGSEVVSKRSRLIKSDLDATIATRANIFKFLEQCRLEDERLRSTPVMYQQHADHKSLEQKISQQVTQLKMLDSKIEDYESQLKMMSAVQDGEEKDFFPSMNV